MIRLSRLLMSVAWVVLDPTLALAASSSAFEYYHGGYGHYFVTAAPPEIAALDSGQFAGWARTGEAFDVLALSEAASANVCRFWSGQTFAPKSSHFYSPFDWECAIAKGYPAWQFEGEVFAMMLPDTFGVCAGGTIPLYRLYNDGKGNAPNHRYTTSMAIRAEMIAQGWIAEGRGIGVIGCVPVHTPASVTVDSPTLSPWLGELMQLTASGRDASGAVIPGTTATWSSSNPAVATISTTGVLQAVAMGSVEVTARINGVAGTQSLTVTQMRRIGITIGAREVVFDYTTDRCEDLDLPDMPVHVVRAENGSLVLFAGNAPRYFVSRGTDFGSFKRDCTRPVLESADRRTPESYENWEWISTVYREGSRWHALISNEFHDAVAGTCRPGDPSPANPCWYNSATYAVSTDGARSFSKPSAPAHVVAPAPNAWEPPLLGASPNSGWQFLEGYFAPGSIVRKGDGYFYGVVGLNPSKAKPPTYETCLIRTDKLGDPASWRAWDGSGFNVRMTSPYVTGSPAPICKLSSEAKGAEITFNTFLDRYMEVGAYRQTYDGKHFCGVFYSLSADLFHWSAQQLITEIRDDGWCAFDPQQSNLLEPVNVMKVSLIDHADTTINFERTGRTPHLYYIRMNAEGVYGDVVRVPLTAFSLD